MARALPFDSTKTGGIVNFRVSVGGAVRIIGKAQAVLTMNMRGFVRETTFKQSYRFMARFDGENFRRLSRSGWKKTTGATIVFNRERTYGSYASRLTKGLLKVHSGNSLPLFDTARLYKSIAWPEKADAGWTREFGVRSWTIGTNVPYASKHIKGQRVLFKYGAEEKNRLLTRIPKPEDWKKIGQPFAIKKTREKITGPDGRVIKIVRGSRNIFKKIPKKAKNERFHYRMNKWAERRYPKRTIVPRRSWIQPVPDNIRKAISAMLADDVSHFIKTGARRQRGRGFDLINISQGGSGF